MTANERLIREFLDALERGSVVGHEGKWYSSDAVQVEFPNTLLPTGATRNLADLKEAGERGREVVRRQTYEIVNIVDAGDKVAVEAIFRASFKRDVGDLSAGDIMMAHLAMFFEIRDGKIVRHHSYDCIVPSNTARPT